MLLNLYYLAGLNIIRFSIHQLIVRDVPPDLKSDREAASAPIGTGVVIYCSWLYQIIRLGNDVVQVLHKYSTRQLRIYQRHVLDLRDSLLNGYFLINGLCRGQIHITLSG